MCTSQFVQGQRFEALPTFHIGSKKVTGQFSVSVYQSKDQSLAYDDKHLRRPIFSDVIIMEKGW